MLVTQCQQLYEFWKKARLVKVKVTPEKSKALETRVIMLKVKTENSSNESLFTDKQPKANNRNNPAFDKKGSRTRWSQADTWWLVS